MPTLTFSTRDLPAREQLDAWRAWYAPMFDVTRADEDQGFTAEAQLWDAGGVMLGRVMAPALHSVRSAGHIRRSAIDHWVITIGRRDTEISLPRGTVRVPAGVPFVSSMGQPLESARDEDERLHLYLPRDRFASLAAVLDGANGVPLGGAMGRLLSDYLGLLMRSLPSLEEADRRRLAGAVHAMVAACLAPTADRQASAAEQVEVAQLARVRQEVRKRLSLATLSPTTLCRAVGMSRSVLYRLLEGEGGVANYIRRQRLLASHDALSDPADRRTIAEIATACGFFEPSSFSRAFRQEFGATPSEVRLAAHAGAQPPAAWKPMMQAEFQTLQTCLCRF